MYLVIANYFSQCTSLVDFDLNCSTHFFSTHLRLFDSKLFTKLIDCLEVSVLLKMKSKS